MYIVITTITVIIGGVVGITVVLPSLDYPT